MRRLPPADQQRDGEQELGGALHQPHAGAAGPPAAPPAVSLPAAGRGAHLSQGDLPPALCEQAGGGGVQTARKKRLSDIQGNISSSITINHLLALQYIYPISPLDSTVHSSSSIPAVRLTLYSVVLPSSLLSFKYFFIHLSIVY